MAGACAGMVGHQRQPQTWQTVVPLVKYLLHCVVLCCTALYDTQCMTYAGTVTYMSPERLENKPYNFAADIW